MDSFSLAFAAAFKAQAIAQGMTVVATITSGGLTANFDVGFVRPDQLRMNGVGRSTEYEIEILDPADCPTLAEGDSIIIGGEAFYVREGVFNDDPGADGTFRRAFLSKVRA